MNLRFLSHMMGNERSQPTGLSIDETATEVTDSWSLHGATYAVGSVPKISVFITSSSNSSEVSQLEKFTKNVMLYRHPCILKYVASWKKGWKFHLATEQVQPLAQVLPSQTALQVCVGLQNILKALVFLHESGSASHNNVCRAAIYVTQGGSWKLGGLEYLCRCNDMSSSYLEETRKSRYEPAIAPNEAEHLPQPPTSVDCYAFGVLAQEVLSNKQSDDVPGMADFLDVCKKGLQNSSSEIRPPLSSLLAHQFFSHEFLTIHNFLLELPIKKDTEKEDFFRNLTMKLNTFPEETVASQLGSLLLSRMVLLDSTAQHFLLPQVFVPRTEGSCMESLFSEATFRTHMVPRLLPLFCVRDVQIRHILLSHFPAYCRLFSQVQLQTRILPELLVGIKDTNDNLVACTLRALAELVPILGGSVVIGGKRAKLFADGRPKVVKSSSKRSSQKDNFKSQTNLMTEMRESAELVLPERPSPDGGEYIPNSTVSEEDEAWPDWEYKTEAQSSDVKSESSGSHNSVECIADSLTPAIETMEVKSKPKASDEFEDIFRDMEPVISKPQIIHVKEVPGVTCNKFALTTEVCEGNDGWGEDFEDWNDIDDITAAKEFSVKS
uniref:Protein kinase domain-containing protein n=2 Tax=Cuerna arida TaxID=1464854 RepID=A0A1B6GZJ3_9HEMI